MTRLYLVCPGCLRALISVEYVGWSAGATVEGKCERCGRSVVAGLAGVSMAEMVVTTAVESNNTMTYTARPAQLPWVVALFTEAEYWQSQGERASAWRP